MQFLKGKHFILAFLSGFFFLTSDSGVNAASNQFITLVNPVRISKYTVDSAESIKAQYKIIKQNKLPATWLFTFDVLDNPKAVAVAKEMDIKQEKGIFLEVTPAFALASKIAYNNSGFWHFANSVFLSGYVPADRVKLIDAVFEKFKSDFGYYPTSVGGWWVDAYSLSYIKEKYGITAHLGLADQLSTDGYEVWGEYWSSPFYPSKNHTGIPAATNDSKLDVVELEWAPRDPLNGYKDSKYSTQDYPLMGQNFDYFERLVRLFAGQHDNQFGQITLGLEGDFPAESYSETSEFAKQMGLVRKLADEGDDTITNMKDFSSWYRKQFPGVSPVQVIKTDDLLGTNEKLIWYNSPNYRAGIRYDATSQKTEIVDLRIYQPDFQEPYFSLPNTNKDLTIYIPSVIDHSTDPQTVWDLKWGGIKAIKQENERLAISFAKDRELVFLPDKFSFSPSIDIPSYLTKSPLVNIQRSGGVAVQPSVNIITSAKGETLRALTSEAWHFLDQKKIKLALLLWGITFIVLVVLCIRFLKIRILLLAVIVAGLAGSFTYGQRWQKSYSQDYWISQNEIYALSKLALQPPGKVLVYDHECLQCVYITSLKPAVFSNNRSYVQKWGKHPLVYNSSVFEAKDLKVGKREFSKQNVRYVYLVKYPYYSEKLPFSPGDFNVEKIYDDANAEIWRVKK